MPDETAAPEQVPMAAPPARSLTVGGSVSLDEQSEILAAFAQAGFRNKSIASRVLFLAFSRDARVRDAVAACIRENPSLLAA